MDFCVSAATKLILDDIKKDGSSKNVVMSSLSMNMMLNMAAASASSAKASPLKSPVTNSRTSTSLDGQSKFSSEEYKSSVVKKEKSSIKQPIRSDSNTEDSEDDIPLSARLKGSTSQGSKGLVKPTTASKLPPMTKSVVEEEEEEEEDSDNEPLSSRFQMKPNAGTSGSKPNDFDDDKKPLLSVNKQNGSAMTDVKKPSNTNKKRPLDGEKSDQSSVKKPKLSESPALLKNKQVSVKAESKVDDEDHVPISQRINKSPTSNNKSSTTRRKVTKPVSSSFKKTTKKSKKGAKNSKYSKSTKLSHSSGDGQKKWTTLIHNGVIFPPPYQPHGVKMLYNGSPVDLTPLQEEVATMFAVMKDTEYAGKEIFRENFWNDWRKLLGKNHVIQKLDLCDFTPIYDWHQGEKEKKKQMSADVKKALKEEKLKQEEKYMWAIVDGVREKVGNFRVEPPSLFLGRGEHPKFGKLKSRIRPSDMTINIGKDAPVPECPIPGERWKEVRHDNTVTWLASWNDPINPKEFKYVHLAASSSLKRQSDKKKYEKARMLKDYIHNIRAAYTKDFTSKDVTKRQIAVATYLIDKLALRAGNEKGDDEADTVGCCTLKVENVKAIAPNKLEFNFLGKDSIRYENTVEVELPVHNAVIKFQSGKKGNDDLFDLLDTSKLNAHLKELMPGLTAKVFRTYNASITLDDMLNRETKDGDLEEKKTLYNTANKQVAIICNHQRTISKSHEAQMSKSTVKIRELEDVLQELKVDLERARKGKPPLKDADRKTKRNLSPEALEKKINKTKGRIAKIKRDMENKEDTKTVALGTSKTNYLDPRITVAWCKRHEVPIEKTQTSDSDTWTQIIIGMPYDLLRHV
ncbi:DNA topoisomerase I [Trema orientale]|uniref:DNA topoisomerase I n=1 Tax=Trema orientale TaxID=63057 RepID=A0A2P5E7I7_TREOI|nr:DNA topoisomerase I [Trema orientale]